MNKTKSAGRFPMTNDEPTAIMTADGNWIIAGKNQKFEESSRGQSWELIDYTGWVKTGMSRRIKVFPKLRVLAWR